MLPPLIQTLLTITGFVFIIIGLLGAISAMKKPKTKAGMLTVKSPVMDFIKILIELLKALKDAPVWMALVFIGIFLIVIANADPVLLSKFFPSEPNP